MLISNELRVCTLSYVLSTIRDAMYYSVTYTCVDEVCNSEFIYHFEFDSIPEDAAPLCMSHSTLKIGY